MALSAEDHQRLNTLLESVAQHSVSLLGYPCARDFNYDAIKPFMDYPLNNVGDPFVAGTNKVESREFELEVVQFWAELMRAPADDWWGYVTNGGTEGNLYGLYLARELHPRGITYFSQDTHYSVSKNLHFLHLPNIMIRSQTNGEIDYDDLYATLQINRDKPPIIFANIGTTMTEAKDDIAKIQTMMKDLALGQYYIHSDAAMSGAIAPFLDPRPPFDFADGADSISISGHKFIGSPIPCGIVLARKRHVNKIARSIAYIGNLDTTVTGSRNGHTPLILWYAMKHMGKEGLKARVQNSLAMAAYAEERLRSIGIAAWRNPNAITVVMPETSVTIREKWQLATANGIAHLILTPNLSESLIDAFVRDMANEQQAGETA